MSKPIIKTTVYHKNKVFFVSTIARDYDTYEGRTEGEETLAWEMHGDNRGPQIYQGTGLCSHFEVCHRLAVFGETEPYDD